jgi:hypothetical protein
MFINGKKKEENKKKISIKGWSLKVKVQLAVADASINDCE